MLKQTLLGAALLLFAGPTWASLIQSTTFLPGPINLTFDDAGQAVPPDHTALTNQFQPQGVDFSGIRYNPVGPNPGTTNNSGNGVGDFASMVAAVNPHFINFVNPTTGLPSPVSSADFSLASQPATATLTALLAGVPVEQHTINSDLFLPNNIVGFTGIVFDSISIFIHPNPTATTQDSADLIDNIQFRSVPEPTSLLLLGIGGLGLSCAAYRRRRA
jgi:hypothetical protein